MHSDMAMGARKCEYSAFLVFVPHTYTPSTHINQCRRLAEEFYSTSIEFNKIHNFLACTTITFYHVGSDCFEIINFPSSNKTLNCFQITDFTR